MSHVDDLLLSDPAAALFAALATLPKKSALTDYSYRTSHKNQRAFLAALDTAMIAGGLATHEEAIFDLDFHAVMAWGSDPALEKHYVPTRSQRSRSVLTFFAQDSGTHNLLLRQRRSVQGHPKPRGHRVLRPPEEGQRHRPAHAGHGPEGHHPARAGRTRAPAASSSSPCGCAPQPSCATSTTCTQRTTRRSLISEAMVAR